MPTRCTIKLWLVSSTDAAYLLTQFPKSEDPIGRRGVWVPRSMIERITKWPAGLNEFQKCEIDIPEWLAVKKGLL